MSLTINDHFVSPERFLASMDEFAIAGRVYQVQSCYHAITRVVGIFSDEESARLAVKALCEADDETKRIYSIVPSDLMVNALTYEVTLECDGFEFHKRFNSKSQMHDYLKWYAEDKNDDELDRVYLTITHDDLKLVYRLDELF